MKIIQPTRASHSYKQHLAGTPDQVFPLLCPVREADWIQGWDPLVVISESKLVERDCVFVTSSLPANAVWYVTRHEPETYFVEMVKVTPGVTACRLTIQVKASHSGSTAEISYTHTSLGAEGDLFVAAFDQNYYASFMADWESNMNHYLTHGCAKPQA